MGSRRLLAAAAAVAVLCIDTAVAAGDLLLYRCGANVCRIAPDGSGKRQLTRGSGTHTWLSASADGSRLAVVRSTFAHVLDGRGREVAGPLPRGGTVVITEASPDGAQVATVELLPEITPAPVGSPPGSPGIAGFQPYLFLMAPDGTARDVVSRAVVDTGWLGAALARTDPGPASPFPLGVCLLAANTESRAGATSPVTRRRTCSTRRSRPTARWSRSSAHPARTSAPARSSSTTPPPRRPCASSSAGRTPSRRGRRTAGGSRSSAAATCTWRGRRAIRGSAASRRAGSSRSGRARRRADSARACACGRGR